MLRVKEWCKSVLPAASRVYYFIGALAAIAGIAMWWKGTPEAQLTVEVHANQFLVPKVGILARDADEIASGVDEVFRSAACSGLGVGEVPFTEAEIAGLTWAGASEENIQACRRAFANHFALKWLNTYSNNAGVMIAYNIRNEGSLAAQNVRIASAGVNELQVRRGREFVPLEPEKGAEYFELPDVNPGQNVEVYLWMLNPIGRSGSSFPAKDLPVVSHAGNRVRMQYLPNIAQ